MRSNCDFIEITGIYGENKFLVNKNAIVFVTRDDSKEHAIIETRTGEHMYKIVTKESYKDVAEEILWNGWYSSQPDFQQVSVGEMKPKEVTND